MQNIKPHRFGRRIASFFLNPQVSLALTAAVLAGCASSGGKSPEAAKPAAGTSARPVHWGYEGKDGPSRWGALTPVYATCDKGAAQSPINLPEAGTGQGAALKFNYRKSSLRIAHHEHVVDIVDNGHTIQVTVDEGSTLSTARDTYHLKQFHFHTPSEHTVAGKSFPMEVHFVHQSDKGQFAVVSALFVEGAANENLARLIRHFPAAKGQTRHLPDEKIELEAHLPTGSSAYSYMGSFTTPPCTEEVEWFVLQKPVTASAAQLKAFADRLGHNNRPTQPLHRRTVGTTAVGIQAR